MIELDFGVDEGLPRDQVVPAKLTHGLLELFGAPIVRGKARLERAGLLEEVGDLGLLSHDLGLQHCMHGILLAYLGDGRVLIRGQFWITWAHGCRTVQMSLFLIVGAHLSDAASLFSL